MKWKNSTKTSVATFCTAYLNFIGKNWKAPHYTKEERFPFIPTEAEIDAIIASARSKHATLLTLMKECGIRTDELMKIQWTDIDTARKTVSITPSKGSNPRILPLSEKLLGMLEALPKTTPTICDVKKKSFRVTFEHLRDATAKKLNSPRIQKITLHTFRHFKGTMEYHKTKDLSEVKRILGHRAVESTMIYINIEQALFLQATDEWNCKVAHNEAEAIQLIEAGFSYVNNLGDTTALYKKRK